MDIKMPILANRYYRMIMRFQEWERSGMCFHLRVQQMNPEDKKSYEGYVDKEEIPTCRCIFYDFEYYRVIEGRLKENMKDRLVLDIGRGKEYEFSLLGSLSA